MTVRVRFTPEAEQQLQELKRWWALNRPAARKQVADEVERVIEQIKTQPQSGLRYQRLENVRSLRLKRTPYRLFYEYRPGSEIVSVVSIWSTMRKHEPPI